MIEISKTRSKLWLPEDLAEYLGVPVSWIYKRTRTGGPEIIPHIKLGKYLRFDPESGAFQQWLSGHAAGGVVGEEANTLTLKFPISRVRATEKTGQVG